MSGPRRKSGEAGTASLAQSQAGEGEDSFIQGQPRRLRSWLVRPRPRLKAGRGFPQAPSPSAGLLGTCGTNLVRGGAKERQSGQELQGCRGCPLAQDAWNRRSSLSRLGRPLASRGKEVSAGAGELGAGSRWRGPSEGPGVKAGSTGAGPAGRRS